MKTKFILHGGFTKGKTDEDNEDFYKEILKDAPENAPPLYSKVLFEKAISSKSIEYFNNESVEVIEGYSDFDNNIFA